MQRVEAYIVVTGVGMRDLRLSLGLGMVRAWNGDD